MTLLECNMIIGKFMSDKQYPPKDLYNTSQCNYYLLPPFGGKRKWFNVTELKYHISWDWIMPVCGKISSLSFNESNDRFQPDLKSFTENEIEIIWSHVISFIQFYNSKNNNN